jgi:hypothetical protein
MDGSHDNTLSAMLYQEVSSGNRIESTSRSGEEAAAKTGKAEVWMLEWQTRFSKPFYS